jgi:two-component system chemotaxis response regulator CheB
VKVRVLVVDDSATVRRMLVELLGRDPGIEVVGQEADGRAALSAVKTLLPDVVTLDLMMPKMDGIEAVRAIMTERPTPIVVLSGASNRGALRTFDALAAGAIDAVEKPEHGLADPAWAAGFVRTVKIAARVKVVPHLHPPSQPAAPLPEDVPAAGHGAPRIVALGASTGGPTAVAHVLRSLGPRFPLPILVVMHLHPAFGDALVDWLGTVAPQRVGWVTHGVALSALQPQVYVAPADTHVAATENALTLERGPVIHGVRPSIDRTFLTLAAHHGSSVVAALLTGMGRDGASGLLALRRAGARTAAQDEATSVVWGMPGEAVRLGAAEEVLPLDGIGPWICKQLAGTRRAGRRR